MKADKKKNIAKKLKVKIKLKKYQEPKKGDYNSRWGMVDENALSTGC